MPKYIVPLPKNIKYEICKPTGEFAHENLIVSKFAIDFKAPVDTPVLAARSGKVLLIKDDSKKWGLDAKLEDANFILIDHGDETYGEYLHLGYKKILVKVDQFVEQGDVIGFIGYSGVMDLPHLHFNVFQDLKNPKSIPMDFK